MYHSDEHIHLHQLEEVEQEEELKNDSYCYLNTIIVAFIWLKELKILIYCFFFVSVVYIAATNTYVHKKLLFSYCKSISFCDQLR